MKNLVDSFKEKLMKNKYIAFIIIIYLLVTSVAIFLQSAEEIYSYFEINPEENDNLIGNPTMEAPNVETLTIYSSRVHADYDTEIIPFNATDLPAILPVFFDCYLTNNGEETLSILDYELIQIGKDYPISYYSYMDGGLFDGTGNQLQFPLNIDSKKSLKIFLKVGISIHPDAYVLISNNFTLRTRISINEINSYLATNGMDLYGNSVEPFIEEGKYFGFKGPNSENLHEQIFLITFKTGSGNYFNDSFSWYKLQTF
ncbi:MAG TPA: hypothetical protein VMW53_03370 [archaeon]|nr:hypothetical protein [archaeon]